MRFLALFLIVLISCEEKKQRVIATLNLKNWEDQMEVIGPLDSSEITSVVKARLEHTWDIDMAEIKAAFPESYIHNLNLSSKRNKYIRDYLKSHEFYWVATGITGKKEKFILVETVFDSSFFGFEKARDLELYHLNDSQDELGKAILIGKYVYIILITSYEENTVVEFLEDGGLISKGSSFHCSDIIDEDGMTCYNYQIIVRYEDNEGTLVEASRDTIRDEKLR